MIRSSGFANRHLRKLGSYPPTEVGKDGPYLQVLAVTVYTFGNFEFSQAGSFFFFNVHVGFGVFFF